LAGTANPRKIEAFQKLIFTKKEIYHNAMPHCAPVVLPFGHVHEFVASIPE
jgi:hypothetical protein